MSSAFLQSPHRPPSPPSVLQQTPQLFVRGSGHNRESGSNVSIDDYSSSLNALSANFSKYSGNATSAASLSHLGSPYSSTLNSAEPFDWSRPEHGCSGLVFPEAKEVQPQSLQQTLTGLHTRVQLRQPNPMFDNNTAIDANWSGRPQNISGTHHLQQQLLGSDEPQSPVSVQVAMQNLPAVADCMNAIQMLSGCQLSIVCGDPGTFQMRIQGSKASVKIAQSMVELCVPDVDGLGRPSSN